jgi:hypothetical protein
MANDFLSLRKNMKDIFGSILKSFENMKLWMPEIDEALREISVNYGSEVPDLRKNREYIMHARNIWSKIKTWKDEDPQKKLEKLEKHLKRNRQNTLSYCYSMAVEDFMEVIEQDQIKDLKIRSRSP